MIEVLKSSDPEVFELCRAEERRQAEKIRLIPSENYVSKAVLEASGSVFTNKYSAGYPGKRYYEGQDFVDPLESLTIERAKGLFGAAHANVQPYSGSPANLAVYLAFLKPGDKVMGLALPMGGHLTHGWNVSITGRYFTSVQYGVRKDTGKIDYDEVRDLAKKERPALLWAGGPAGLQGLREESGRQRARAGGRPDRPRLRRRVGRDRQSPDPGRPDQQERPRQGRGQGAGQGRHRVELQLGALRYAQAFRPLGDPPGFAGGHQPRDGRDGNEADRGLDGPGDRVPRRQDLRRGAGRGPGSD